MRLLEISGGKLRMVLVKWSRALSVSQSGLMKFFYPKWPNKFGCWVWFLSITQIDGVFPVMNMCFSWAICDVSQIPNLRSLCSGVIWVLQFFCLLERAILVQKPPSFFFRIAERLVSFIIFFWLWQMKRVAGVRGYRGRRCLKSREFSQLFQKLVFKTSFVGFSASNSSGPLIFEPHQTPGFYPTKIWRTLSVEPAPPAPLNPQGSEEASYSAAFSTMAGGQERSPGWDTKNWPLFCRTRRAKFFLK